MKWLKKHKYKISLVAQSFFVLVLMVIGFYNIFLQACFLLGVPIGWSVAIGLIFSLLSTYGLFLWITNMKEEDML